MMNTNRDQMAEPVTLILGDSYELVSRPNQHWRIAMTMYNAVLKAVIVAAVVILVMVKAGVLDVGDSDVQDNWVEVASQVVNGVATWIAITDHPSYVYRLVMASHVLNASHVNGNDGLGRSVRAASYLHQHFPLVFVDTTIGRGNTAFHFDVRCSDDDDGDMNSTTKFEVIGIVGTIVFFCNDVKILRNAFVFLNCGCLLQYVMSGFMWGYDASSRPGFVLPALLPPIVLCNIAGQYRLYQLDKRTKNLQIQTAPYPGELSSTHNSLVSL